MICNLKLLWFWVFLRVPSSDHTSPMLPSQHHKTTEQRKIPVTNQSHNNCRCIWSPLLVTSRFYSRGQQPFLLLGNNCISKNVATTRLTISLLATTALYLQLRKVTGQLGGLLLINWMFYFCYKVLYKEKSNTLIDHLILIMPFWAIDLSQQNKTIAEVAIIVQEYHRRTTCWYVVAKQFYSKCKSLVSIFSHYIEISHPHA